jgi:hypothetical protein
MSNSVTKSERKNSEKDEEKTSTRRCDYIDNLWFTAEHDAAV